jgi:hypothetical protein
MVQKPVFSGVPGINKNFNIIQNSSPMDMFEIFFSQEMFKRIQKETNRYAMQQINKKKHEGLQTPNSICAQWNTISLQEIKKNLCCNHTHEPVMQVISAGLLEFVSDYSHSKRLLLECLKTGFSHY